MNLFYISLILTFASLLFLENKKIAFFISFVLLFIPWGLQFQATQDWDVNLLRWDFVNVNAKVGLDGEDRELEPLYTLILKACKPLSFYGFLMLSGLVELSVIFLFIKKYVNPSYYWVSIFILMIKVNYGLLFINSNRQTLSVICVMVAAYFMINAKLPKSLKDKNILYIFLSVLMFIAAPKIHSSSYISYIIIPLYFLIKWVKSPNRIFLFALCNVLYVSRFLIDAENYQFFASLYLNSLHIEEINFFDKYLEGLDNENLVSSRFNQLVEWSMMNLLIFFYHKLSTEHRFFGAMWILSYLLGGFLMHTLARITVYFYIFLIFVAPRVFELINEKVDKKNILLLSIYLTTILFFLNNFRVNMTDDGEGRYYYKWHDFKTVFEAPDWK